MTRNLANTRHGIPRGGLKGPATFAPKLTRDFADAARRPGRGGTNGSPSVLTDGLK